MKQAKKKLTMAIGMAVGVTMLAGAAFASYNTASGYEVGKKALKGLLSNENYTSNVEFKMSVDGNEILKTNIEELYDRDGDVRRNNSEKTSYSTSFGGGESGYESYSQDGDFISIYYPMDGEAQTSVYKGDSYMGSGSFDEMNSMDENEKETMNKVIRFAELAADTFVGDLKNNFVYVSGDDNSAEYEINLDAVQIPEIVNAGLSAMFSTMNNQDYSSVEVDPFLTLGDDPIVKCASLKFSVDNEGRLTDATANITMSGDGHEAAIDISGTITGYGTTVPQRADISALPNVQTYDMSENSGSYHSYRVSAEEEAKANDYHIDENGNVLDNEENVVGTVEINGDGEGVIVYNN